jgi:hypothetical protein
LNFNWFLRELIINEIGFKFWLVRIEFNHAHTHMR